MPSSAVCNREEEVAAPSDVVAMGEKLHMTQLRRLERSSTLAAALCAFAVAATGLPCAGHAQAANSKQASQTDKDSKASQDEAKKKAAHEAYDAGLKQFANGRYQPAIEQLSAALKSGGLSSTEIAKALYRRGVAYKRQKQPGLAISDLTSALWLKDGLSGSDREAATAERAEAYQMAGVQDTGKGPERVVAETTSGANASSAGLSAAAIAQAAARNADKGSAAATEAARQRAAYAPVDSLAGQAVTVHSQSAAPATTASSIGSSVKGFFSNLFGGSAGTSAPVQAPAGVTTASAEPETSSWSTATVVKEGAAAAEPSKATHLGAAHEAEGASRATKGKYKIHIAALRSRAEAEALAQKIETQHAGDLDNRVPTVDKKVIGSMGTFYRVRIGGYASQDEPRGICNKLRSSGLDCLVVTN